MNTWTAAPRVSLWLTIASLTLGLVSVQLGRRVNYVEHLAVFNLLAATMLGLVAIALVVSVVALLRAQGRGASRWLAAVLATVVLLSYLFDE